MVVVKSRYRPTWIAQLPRPGRRPTCGDFALRKSFLRNALPALGDDAPRGSPEPLSGYAAGGLAHSELFAKLIWQMKKTSFTRQPFQYLRQAHDLH